MTAAEDFGRGRELLASSRPLEALLWLERAYAAEPGNAQYRSYFGLILAQERGQLRQSLDLCRSAVDLDPTSADLYANLSEVCVRAGRKAEAIEALRRGLRHSPAHGVLGDRLVRLGVRREPLFRSLPRSHPLNKYLGLLAARLRLR